MDKFYLSNATLYQKLVKDFKPLPVSEPRSKGRESLRASLTVAVRIRSMSEEDVTAGYPCAIFSRSPRTNVIDAHDLYNHPRGRPILKSSHFQVDELFAAESTSREIYEKLVEDLVSLSWNGGVGTLFAYGQTGSGKTFTVTELQHCVVDTLMGGSFTDERRVKLTIIELAGNVACDLLNARKSVAILADSSGITQLVGATEHQVVEKDAMLNLIDGAASLRQTASTSKNDASSRSHAICRIRITNLTDGTDGILYLVDLAGSEAARDVASHGADRMRETREINMSLSVLKDCIRGKAALDHHITLGGLESKQKKPHRPVRQSALTRVLKHVFDPGESRGHKTVVIACLNPSLADVGPSRNTLRYAEMLCGLTSNSDQVELGLTGVYRKVRT